MFRKFKRHRQKTQQNHVGGLFVAKFPGHAGGVQRETVFDARKNMIRRFARVAGLGAALAVQAGERWYDVLGV